MSEQIGGLESIDAMDESEGLNHGMTKRQFLTALGTATAAVAALGPAETVVSAPATIKSASIDYWTFFNPKDDNARSKAQNMMLESFKKKYPNIDVNITVYPWQRIDQQLTLAVKAGRAPDLSRAYLPLMAQHAAANDLMPLDQYVSDWSDEQKGQFVTPWDSTVFNGHKLSFFIEARCYTLVYRKDLIAEPPQSWDELGQIGAKLTVPPVYGVGIPLSEKGHASGLYEWLFPTLWGAGGDFLTNDGKAAFASAAGIKAYQLLYDLVHKYKAMPESSVSDDIEAITQNMMAGTDTMAIVGTHRITLMSTGTVAKNNLGIALIPSFEKGKASPTFSDGWQAVIPRGAKNPDAAWALMQHILDPESQLTNVKVAGELPSVRTVLNDPWFNSPEGADFGFALKYLGESKKNTVFPATWEQLMDNLATAAQQVVAGQKSPTDALSAVAKKFDSWKS